MNRVVEGADYDWPDDDDHYISPVPRDFRIKLMNRYQSTSNPHQPPLSTEEQLSAPGTEKVFFWDTRLRVEIARALINRQLGQSHGVILMFDLTCQESFDELPQWLELTQPFVAEGKPVILVGHKLDCCDPVAVAQNNHFSTNNQRQVSTNDALALANQNDIQYFEASAKTGVGVEEAVMAITRMIWDPFGSNKLDAEMSNQHVDVDFESREMNHEVSSHSRCFWRLGKRK